MPDAKTFGQFLVDGMIVVEERETGGRRGIEASKNSRVHAFVPCLLNNALPKAQKRSHTFKNPKTFK
jgi:hypothetical protein